MHSQKRVDWRMNHVNASVHERNGPEARFMPEPKPDKMVNRKERLAAELRANLSKRKAQARARLERTGERADAEPDLRRPDPSVKP